MAVFICSACPVTYDSLEGNFHKNKSSENGYCESCATCRNKRNKKYRDERFESHLRFEARERRIEKNRYNISDEQAAKYFEAANNIFNKSKFTENYSWKDLKKFNISQIV